MSKINKMFVLRIVHRTTDGHVLFKLTRINWPEGSKKTEVIVSKLLWRASMHFSCLDWIVKIYQRVRHLNAVSICHSSMPTSQFGYVFSITYCVYGTYAIPEDMIRNTRYVMCRTFIPISESCVRADNTGSGSRRTQGIQRHSLRLRSNRYLTHGQIRVDFQHNTAQ